MRVSRILSCLTSHEHGLHPPCSLECLCELTSTFAPSLMAVYFDTSNVRSRTSLLCLSEAPYYARILRFLPASVGFKYPGVGKVALVSCCGGGSGQTKKVEVRKGGRKALFSHGRDEDERRLVCPGCGVFMQDEDPNLPGYYKRRVLVKEEEEMFDGFMSDFEDESEVEGDEGDVYDSLDSEDVEFGEDVVDEFNEKMVVVEEEKDNLLGKKLDLDWDSDWETDSEGEQLDGFAPAGIGYGNITEEVLNRNKKQKISKSEKKRRARVAQVEKDDVTVCARCHSLRNYGQVKNEAIENLIPDFDFDRLIASRIMKSTSSSSNVVVMVVDCVDFDGSFPKKAAKSLFKASEGDKKGAKMTKLPKLILVGTKVDLLPSQISPARLEKWVRSQAKVGGAPKLSGVYLVSARKDVGVRNLLAFIKETAGPRGNVWVIGAQNAGKSTLINVMAKKEGAKMTRLTEAAVPGTTLGILRIKGILPANAKLYDTPGLLHPYLMSIRLSRDEQKMVEIRKELQPRTYRIKAGQTVHVGALVRLDLAQASVQTIYVTVWASPSISLHLGKIENADEIRQKHGGVRLQPPTGEDRVHELGEWKRKEFKVSGASWDVNSVDIAVAGLGWFSFGLKGEATLTLWTFEGVEITTREPLVLDRAQFLERSGFYLPQAISEAIGNQSKESKETLKKNDVFSEVIC